MKQKDGETAVLETSWRAINVARDAKGIVMTRAGVVLRANALLGRLLQCSAASLEGKSVFGDLLARPRGKDLRKAVTRWTTVMVAQTGTRIPVEVVRERLNITNDAIEVYAIRDLRPKRGEALKRKRQRATLQQRDQELLAQSQRFEMALKSLWQGVCVFDADQRLVICNEAYLRMYGLTRDGAKPGTTLLEILRQRIGHGLYSGSSPEDYIRERFDTVSTGQPAIHTHTFSDGRVIRLGHHPIPGGGWVATHDDVTEQQILSARLKQQNELLKEQEHQLRLQNLHLDAALNNMSQGLILFDKDRRVVMCNKRYMEIYGLTSEQVQPGTPISHLIRHRLALGLKVHSEHGDYVRARVEGAVAPANAFHEFADGRTIAYAIRPLPDGGGVATHEDVTEQRRIEARIKHMAHHDALTDLPNRVLLRERLEDALKGDAPVGVLWLDLDRFKEVNDTLGHAVGDALLKAAAERLQSCVRDRDTVARLGGDEFAVIQTGADQPLGATTLALRVIEAISEPYQIGDHRIVISTSVGISVSPHDATDASQLLRNADLALYRAKNEGRGTYRFFELGMDARMHARRQLELDLRSALADNGFEVHYQPIINLDTNNITAFEALLRWNHPERGSISPAEFIPLAEETGLIASIGAWVLREACRHAQTWPDSIRVAVNLSPLQFRQNDLVPLVVNVLAASGLAPARLDLEITESVLLENTENTLGKLRQLRALGVRISMDDFGTGFSSLSNLRSFAFDNIKIDRSFIQGLGHSEQCSAIVQAVAGLGAGLDVTTTAEGVETADQLEWVRAFGIVEVQGFFLGCPVPASQVEGMIADNELRAASAA
jgi:diguanylate cyclase (GGDEF)-like protein